MGDQLRTEPEQAVPSPEGLLGVPSLPAEMDLFLPSQRWIIRSPHSQVT